jgi:hypothetical protein
MSKCGRVTQASSVMTATTQIAVGDILIQRILEMEIPFRTPEHLFPDSPPEVIDAHRHWMEPWAMCSETGKMIIAVQSYLLRTSRHPLLIEPRWVSRRPFRLSHAATAVCAGMA